MTPDYFFPGCGGLLAHRLGMRPTPAFDIRQQCTGFLYGLQLADAHIRSGMAKRVLLVGAEVHSGFMPWREGSWARLRGEVDAPLADGEWDMNTATRDRTVLFGDAGAAVVLEAREEAEPARGVLDTTLFADGGDAEKLCVPGIGFRHRPYVDAGMIERADYVPVMEGRHVFRMATSKMSEVAKAILARNNLGLDDVSMVLMHQANKRINEFTQRHLGIARRTRWPTTSRSTRTRPPARSRLLWDECVAGWTHPPGRSRLDGRLRRRDDLGGGARQGLTGVAERRRSRSGPAPWTVRSFSCRERMECAQFALGPLIPRLPAGNNPVAPIVVGGWRWCLVFVS